MSHALHGFRIRALQGRIQTTIYSNTTISNSPAHQAHVQGLRLELDEWRASCPPLKPPPPSGTLSFFTTTDWFAVNYNYAILQLYRVQITDRKGGDREQIFMECLQAAKSICNSFRRQFFGNPTTYTWGALHELFLAGLTYLYCLWTSPAARRATRHDYISSTCTDCTMVLVKLAEQWSHAAPYRDIFESLASRTMTMMADQQRGGEEPSTATIPPDQQNLSQWWAGIADTGGPVGVEWILDELMNDLSSQEQHANIGQPWDGIDTSYNGST